ncbi:MAG TPA: hypothetical protein VGF40_15560 [Thermoanaerobaculia bacterium]
MRKNLFVRAQSLYITVFLLAATVAQARPRALNPDGPESTWEVIQRTFVIVRRAFDVVRIPIG